MIFVRQESESGSEGSGSSQSDSESDDDGNDQPQMQHRHPLPSSFYYPAMQMSSPPAHPQHILNNNPTTPTQKKKFEERVCMVYFLFDNFFLPSLSTGQSK